MDMDIQELIYTVSLGLKLEKQFNRNHIPLKEGELIVCGYTDNDTGGDQEYICMGEYRGGDLNLINISNEVVLSHVRVNGEIVETPKKGTYHSECCDAFTWWRLPNEHELKLYKHIGNDLEYFVRTFDDFIWQYTNDENSVDMEQLMTKLSDFVELFKWQKK